MRITGRRRGCWVGLSLRILQLAASGYGPGEDVLRALADAELAVLVRADGELVTAATTEGAAVVPTFTSPP
jgi:hypothetical protein